MLPSVANDVSKLSEIIELSVTQLVTTTVCADVAGVGIGSRVCVEGGERAAVRGRAGTRMRSEKSLMSFSPSLSSSVSPRSDRK